MESKPTRISEYSLRKIRYFGKEFGEPTADTALRHLFSEYEKLKVENELLKKKLEEVREIVKTEMEKAGELFLTDLPCIAETKVSDTWEK